MSGQYISNNYRYKINTPVTIFTGVFYIVSITLLDDEPDHVGNKPFV